MKVAIASDHAGIDVVQALTETLRGMGHEVLSLGPTTTDSVDYPDYAQAVAKAVTTGEAERGVLVCGTGLGMSMAANKVPGIRAALIHSPFTAEMARRHNDANIACFGARTADVADMQAWLSLYMQTPFEGGRHERRVQKLENSATQS